MKKIRRYLSILLALTIILGGMRFSCLSAGAAEKKTQIQLKIGNTKFKAAFEDNKTTRALLKKIPVTYTMSELNGNEKYKYLSYELPTNEKQVKMIHAGDIMLYGSDCIVIFYKDFKTSYSYTRLGKITEPSGLEKAVTKGKVKVQFSVAKKKIALNKTKLTLEKGSSFRLKLLNVKAKKVKWSIQNKKIATVKNGKVNAKKKGTTKVVAKYGKKKYKCSLTVTEKKKSVATQSPYATRASEPEEPFQTEEPKETPVQTEEPKETPEVTEGPVQTEQPQEESRAMMKMKIDGVEVSVEWEDNESVKELKKMAENGEITISMSMYGGFEQVGPLGASLTRRDVQVTTEPGDIVLYSGSQIVVFYGSHSWAYTRLGKIRGMTDGELKNLLGNGNVTMKIY